jgi:hypothetical protein
MIDSWHVDHNVRTSTLTNRISAMGIDCFECSIQVALFISTEVYDMRADIDGSIAIRLTNSQFQ